MKNKPDFDDTVDFTKKASKKGMSVLKKVLTFALPAVVVLILLFSSMYTIKEQEQAVLSTFGKARAVTTPGLHFKVPFIQKVTKVNTTIKGFSIGYYEDTDESNDEEAIMITSDYNFVNVDFYVEYKFSDPVKAVYASDEPEEILRNISQSCIRNVIGTYDVDGVLTTEKNAIQVKIKEDIMKKLEQNEIGVQLVNITIQDAEPPTVEVLSAFKAVETAKQGKETAINNANKYRNEKLPEAISRVDKILKDAEAQKQQRINEANAEVARFNAMYAEYIKNPAVTRQRMYYEAIEKVLPGQKIIISGSDSVQQVLPLDSFVTGQEEKATEEVTGQ